MPSPSLEQEAMDRVSRMYASFDRRERHNRPPMPQHEPQPEPPKPPEPQHEPKPELPERSLGLLELLMKDQEQSLILLLLVLLMKDGADMNLLLALVYLLI